MIEAVLFDLDGTLADTAPDLGGALNRLLAEHGRPTLSHEVLRPHVSAGARGLIGIGFGLAPHDDDYGMLRERFLDLYEAAICEGTVLFAGMAELIDAIEARDIRWGVVTNKPQRFTLPLMERLGLRHRADCLISGDSAPFPKPDPRPMQLACAIAGAPPAATLYVGDDLRDVQAGKAAGLRTVAAAYGYLGDGPPIGTWGAELLIDTPSELIATLDSSV